MTDDDPRDVALSALASGARVLVMLADERLEGHIDGLRHGGFTLIAKVPTGRIERFLYYADIESMAEFVEEDEGPGDVDELQALSRRLREQGEAAARRSLAEREIANLQRES